MVFDSTFATRFRIPVRAGGPIFRRAPDLLTDRSALLVSANTPPLGPAKRFALAGLLRPAGLWLLRARPQPLKNGLGSPHSNER